MTTSMKAIETYIYLQVILPLKNLEIDRFSCQNPLKSTILEVNREQLSLSRGSDFQHNFQRDKLREEARWFVLCNGMIVAAYEDKRHTVKIYKGGFGNNKWRSILIGKLEDAFHKSHPFTKVTIEE
jgi:hypothetical protein